MKVLPKVAHDQFLLTASIGRDFSSQMCGYQQTKVKRNVSIASESSKVFLLIRIGMKKAVFLSFFFARLVRNLISSSEATYT